MGGGGGVTVFCIGCFVNADEFTLFGLTWAERGGVEWNRCPLLDVESRAGVGFAVGLPADWTALDRTGLDRTGPEWTGMDRTGPDSIAGPGCPCPAATRCVCKWVRSYRRDGMQFHAMSSLRDTMGHVCTRGSIAAGYVHMRQLWGS